MVASIARVSIYGELEIAFSEDIALAGNLAAKDLISIQVVVSAARQQPEHDVLSSWSLTAIKPKKLIIKMEMRDEGVSG